MSNNIHIYGRDLWPQQLKEIPDPPDTLYIKGEMATPPQNREQKFVCVVGSRKASPYGKDMCEQIISGLAGYPITIVSGLALGIDACAHSSALRAGLHTIAFPGSGLGEHVLYPRSNHRLAEEIISAGGALISEYAPDTVSGPWAFPRRNRLMAALCELVIIIECRKESGSLITARLALDYNRMVGTVPGSVFSTHSEGPHYLLRQGASIIESSADVLELLGFAGPDAPPQLFDNLPTDEQKVAEALSYPMPRDTLIEILGWPAHQIQIVLARMEIKGLIEEKLGEIRLKICKK